MKPSLSIVLFFVLLLSAASVQAQHCELEKMSSFVRRLALEETARQRAAHAPSALSQKERELFAFVSLSESSDSALTANGCRVLYRQGDLCIAAIPLNCLPALSCSAQVRRIEARKGSRALLDSVRTEVGAESAWKGIAPLTQAFSGRGVVVGVQDIGFDLTHPTFRDSTLLRTRILTLWDQLSTDTVGSALPVGRSYEGSEALLSLGHSRDGLIMAHGSHTLGIAAGRGYNGEYSGMAPESDICLVANATSDNASLIDSADVYKYTYALDALGFKYMFDYADSLGKPCVVSFSEGSGEDLRGDDRLFYAMLDSITGPGHIIVASAGNSGARHCYLKKSAAVKSLSTILSTSDRSGSLTLCGRGAYGLRLICRGEQNDTLTATTAGVLGSADSLLTDTLRLRGSDVSVIVAGYPSSFDASSTALEVVLRSDSPLNSGFITIEMFSDTTEVELLTSSFELVGQSPEYEAGEASHSILSPSSAPSVISVGATSYRSYYTNYQGNVVNTNHAQGGLRAWYSSVGPTWDGRTKPDVMAPGSNIISSYNSFFLENNPNDYHVAADVERFSFGGRTYEWNCNTGTSMSAPVVAGVVALWLQANPQLTPEGVLRVISLTSTHPDASLTYPNNYYGYGQIDAYAGLLHILGLTGIKGLADHQPAELKLTLRGTTLRVEADSPLVRPLLLRVYSTDGRQILTKQLPAGAAIYEVALSTLPAGVYAVQADGGSTELHGSTLIRL